MFRYAIYLKYADTQVIFVFLFDDAEPRLLFVSLGIEEDETLRFRQVCSAQDDFFLSF